MHHLSGRVNNPVCWLTAGVGDILCSLDLIASVRQKSIGGKSSVLEMSIALSTELIPLPLNCLNSAQEKILWL